VKRIGRNIPASIHARLRNRALAQNEDFNLTLQRYVAERFLYRLGASKYRQQLVLKGAMLLPMWGGDLYRATRDVDLAGYMPDDADAVTATFRDLCAVASPDDGMTFVPESVRVEPIRESGQYHGLRVKLVAQLGNARLTLQVDVGFGDAIVPPATDGEYPTLLDGAAPRIRAYPPETVIAEKLHAMVTLGTVNTRYKDFYDVYSLSRSLSFDGAILRQATIATFARRGTELTDARPVSLGPGYYADTGRQAGWQRYLNRSALAGVPADFSLIGEANLLFLGPLWDALTGGSASSQAWMPRGPWSGVGPSGDPTHE
jgi:predicted nucleotidyltransferase component of viral defense system